MLFKYQAMASLRAYLVNLNLFDSNPDQDRPQLNIISTRIYLFILVLILGSVALALSLIPRTTIVTIHYPTKEQCEVLPLDANCPCSRISLTYGEFTSLKASFHQVCSSDFVSDRWTKAIYSGENSTYFNVMDFRTYGSAQFQALAGFCRLSDMHIRQSISSLRTNSLISPQLLPEPVFRSQTNAAVGEYQLTVPNTFRTQLQFMKETTRANKLVSGLQTNSMLRYVQSWDNTTIIDLLTIRYQHMNKTICDCGTDLDCNIPSGIYDLYGETTQQSYPGNVAILMTIPGLSSGCTPVNSMLSSTLECFYDQSCVDELISFFPTTERFTAMLTPEKTRFLRNATVQSVTDLLMVEEWMGRDLLREVLCPVCPLVMHPFQSGRERISPRIN